MAPDQLGRRYERLLVLTAPLSFAAIVVLFIAVASGAQKDQTYARCYEFAADAISKSRLELEDKWNKAKTERRSRYGAIEYKYALTKAWINPSGVQCYNLLNSEVEMRYQAAPKEIAAKFMADAKALASKPFQHSGIEVPDKATINIFGTHLSVSLTTFTQFLQILLGPLLVWWLSSVYRTRYRETVIVGSTPWLTDVFPHVVNVYAHDTLPQARRKRWSIDWSPRAKEVWCATVRVFLVSIFVLPPVVAYLWSLYVLHSDEHLILSLILGLLVFVSGAANVALEVMPWHVRKAIAPVGARG